MRDDWGGVKEKGTGIEAMTYSSTATSSHLGAMSAIEVRVPQTLGRLGVRIGMVLQISSRARRSRALIGGGDAWGDGSRARAGGAEQEPAACPPWQAFVVCRMPYAVCRMPYAVCRGRSSSAIAGGISSVMEVVTKALWVAAI